MSKEKNNPEDELFDSEVNMVMRGEEAKIGVEEQARRALWAFSLLIEEKEITPETTFHQLLQIVRKRRSEMRQTIANAGDVLENLPDNVKEKEFRDIAKQESEKAKRLLKSIEAAEAELVRINVININPNLTLKTIQDRILKRIETIEQAFDLNDTELRKRSEENKEKRDKEKGEE